MAQLPWATFSMELRAWFLRSNKEIVVQILFDGQKRDGFISCWFWFLPGFFLFCFVFSPPQLDLVPLLCFTTDLKISFSCPSRSPPLWTSHQLLAVWAQTAVLQQKSQPVFIIPPRWIYIYTFTSSLSCLPREAFCATFGKETGVFVQVPLDWRWFLKPF